MAKTFFILPIIRWADAVGGNSSKVEDLFGSLVGKALLSPLAYLGDVQATWTVDIIRPTDADVALIHAGRREGVPFHDAVRFTFNVDYPGARAAREAMKYRGTEFPVRLLWNDLLRESLNAEVFCIQLAADLAHPGAALAGTGLMRIGRRSAVYRPPYTHMWECYDWIDEKGIPTSEPIPFEVCWDYLSRVNGLRDGTGSTPAAKALAAFTYLYDEGSWTDERLAPLVWACAGLEGFYGEGAGERFAQLRQKVPAFLDLRGDESEKRLRQLYAVRSKLMHGNRSLSSAVTGYNGLPDKHFEEESDAKYVGKFYLCETIREAIRRGIEVPRFRVIAEPDLSSP